MKILILNSILYTPRINAKGKREIPHVNSIADCMIIQVAQAFVNDGHNVTLIAAEDYRLKKEMIFPFEIHYLKSTFPKVFPPTELPLHGELWHYLKKYGRDFDLVLTSELFSFNSLFAALLCKGKTIVWQESGQHNRKFFRLPSIVWYNVVARFLMNKVLVVPRSEVAKRFVEQFNISTNPFIIDHGVNSDIFKPQVIKKHYFMVIARLDVDKNVISIIAKYRRYIESCPQTDFQLHIVGEGNERNALQSYVDKFKLNDRVCFLGRIPHVELSQRLANATCLLCNSNREFNMISIIESICVATPVLTNKVPYSHEIILKHHLGIAKNDWDVDDIKEIIKRNSYYVEQCIRYMPCLHLSKLPAQFMKARQNFIRL